jgi:hypothetical protein
MKSKYIFIIFSKENREDCCVLITSLIRKEILLDDFCNIKSSKVFIVGDLKRKARIVIKLYSKAIDLPIVYIQEIKKNKGIKMREFYRSLLKEFYKRGYIYCELFFINLFLRHILSYIWFTDECICLFFALVLSVVINSLKFTEKEYIYKDKDINCCDSMTYKDICKNVPTVEQLKIENEEKID